MAAAYCSHCGAPLTPGSRFCAYCGTTIAGPAPSGPTPLAPASFQGSSPPPMPPVYSSPYAAKPPHRPRWLIVAAILVVIVLVLGVILYVFIVTAPGAPIQVNEINIWAPDNVCGLNSNPISYWGWNGSTDQVQSIEFGMQNFNTSSCTIQSVLTNTTGFGLSNVQTPLTIPGNATVDMNMTFKSPSSDYTGALNLVFR